MDFSKLNKPLILKDILNCKVPQDFQGGVFAIGNFDGVHKGHQKAIFEAKKLALLLQNLEQQNQSQNLENNKIGKELENYGAITFSPHPVAFFKKPQSFFLTLEAQKIDLLYFYGAKKIILINFAEIYHLSAEEFFNKILVDKLKIKGLVSGANFTFGKNKEGSKKNLEELALSKGIKYSIVEEVKAEGDTICSSSLIRDNLSQGELQKAKKYLGHNFMVKGEVVHGTKLARTLGFPTANLLINEYVTLKYGVYGVAVIIGNTRYFGIANFGLRPTFHKDKIEVLEVHIFDYSGDLYGLHLEVEFLEFIRSEVKFTSIENLKKQIEVDIISVKNILSTIK
ncbi:Bifunctional riboflavin kinase/FAD synthetase [Candidatus Hepatincolaceae symbiont of Richtersius coronifer]